MNKRRYWLNKKALAVTRAIGAPGSHWDYVYCSPKGVVCTNTVSLIRISLPQTDDAIPTDACIFTDEQISAAQEQATKKSDMVEMPEGLEPKQGVYNITNFDSAVPTADNQQAAILVNAKVLIELLQAACTVTEHSRNLIKLRICNNQTVLRIDSHRGDDEQEFVGIQTAIRYDGKCIPGDPKNGNTATKSEAVEIMKLSLPLSAGRKFRE